MSQTFPGPQMESPDVEPVAVCATAETALRVLGRAWAGAVVEALLAGATRFSDIRRAVPGITDAVLTTRLRELCARGLVVREVDAGPPTVVGYRLTDAGRDVAPVLEALRAFALAHPELLG